MRTKWERRAKPKPEPEETEERREQEFLFVQIINNLCEQTLKRESFTYARI